MNNKSKVMSLLLTGCLLLSGCSTILEKDVIVTSNIKTNESTVIQQTSATIQLNEGANTIEKSGTYEVAGTVKDGSLIIDIDKEVDSGLVTIILNQVEIHSSNSAPIYVKGASEVLIILKEGTTNTLTQGKDIIEDAEGEPNAVLYSKADITLQGPGSLLVLSEYNDGIVSKDTLTIQSGSYEIEVVGDGIVGKDLLEVFDGDFNITTGGGFSSSAMSSSNSNTGQTGMRPGTMQTTLVEQESTSAKGIKTEGDLIIHTGQFYLSTLDDSLHANGNIIIEDGSYTLLSSDDAIHADALVHIQEGQINIQESYEGIEGTTIIIEGGELDIQSADDGFNCNVSTGLLTINGGIVRMNALGDGVDSNGSIVMTGGQVYVSGPTNDGNGALDYDRSFEIRGGELIAAGSSGMAQVPSSSSTQSSILMYFSKAQAAETTIVLADSNGAELLKFSPENTFSSLAMSHSEFKVGQSYSLYANGVLVVTFSLGSNVTYVNESGVTTAQGMGGMGFPGGVRVKTR